MSYPKEIAHCLLHLFPNSVPEKDWSVSINGEGVATIDKWNDKIGTKPTVDEAKAVIVEALKTRKFRQIRDQRNNLLIETDWLGNSDVDMSAEWKKYRQDLRDLPASNADPDKITFPDKPTE